MNDLTIQPHQQTHQGGEVNLALAVLLFAVGLSTLIEHGLASLPAALTALGAIAGGIATLLPALSIYLDRRQSRRHAEERHRASQER